VPDFSAAGRFASDIYFKPMPRILVADDHPAVRRCLREILERQDGWEICAEAATGRQAVDLAATTQPDLVLLDLSMPELDGLQAARHIHERFPQMAMVIITGYDVVELTDKAKTFGVRTCVSKTDPKHFLEAIRSVLQQIEYTNTASDQPCPPSRSVAKTIR